MVQIILSTNLAPELTTVYLVAQESMLQLALLLPQLEILFHQELFTKESAMLLLKTFRTCLKFESLELGVLVSQKKDSSIGSFFCKFWLI